MTTWNTIPDSDLLNTTRTTLEIVETIRQQDGARLAELAADLDLARSTVHAHLQTLRDGRYVVKEGNEYHLGLKFFELGEYTITRKDVYEVAKRTVNDLSNRIETVADFSIEEHGRVISLFSDLYHTSDHDFLTDRRTFYMHNTAAGKAMLAEFTEEQVDAVIDRWGLPAETEHSLTDREALETELEEVRDRGYAINDEETIEGLFSLGIAVTSPAGRVCGAISLDHPTYRVREDKRETLVDELERARDEIERIAFEEHSGTVQ